MMLQTQPTIFHFTHHKSGSQWVHNFWLLLAKDRLVKPLAGNQQVAQVPIAPGMVYPTVYMSRYEFEALPEIPESHICYATIRDFRDVLISLYFSMRYSHGKTNAVDAWRDFLNEAPQDQALLSLINHAMSLNIMTALSWVRAETPLFRYEDLLANAFAEFKRMTEVCQIDISDFALSQIVQACSFETLSRGRQSGSEDINSHYRKGVSGDWRNYLKGEVLAVFKENFDHALIESGYETSRDWGLDLLPAQFAVPAIPVSPAKCWCGSQTFEPFSDIYQLCSQCKTLNRVTTGNLETPPKKISFATSKHLFDLYGNGSTTLIVADHLRHLIGKNGRVLEVFARAGNLSLVLQDQGYTVTSLDNLPGCADYAAQTFGLEVQNGTVLDIELPEGKFDAIIFWDRRLSAVRGWNNNLELLGEPLAMLEKCRHLLKEDGVIIAIPYLFNNLESTHQPDEMRSIEEQGYMLPDRPRFGFTEYSFERLLKAAGFENTMRVVQRLAPDTRLMILIASMKVLETDYSNFKFTDLERPDYWLRQSIGSRQLNTLQAKIVREVYLNYTQNLQNPLLGAAVRIGSGWHNLENDGAEYFRWAANDVELIVQHHAEPVAVTLEVEPGPSLNGKALHLQVLDRTGTLLAETKLSWRGSVTANFVPKNVGETIIILRAVNAENKPIPGDPRLLNFRLLRMDASLVASGGSQQQPTLRARRFISKFVSR